MANLKSGAGEVSQEHQIVPEDKEVFKDTGTSGRGFSLAKYGTI